MFPWRASHGALRSWWESTEKLLPNQLLLVQLRHWPAYVLVIRIWEWALSIDVSGICPMMKINPAFPTSPAKPFRLWQRVQRCSISSSPRQALLAVAGDS